MKDKESIEIIQHGGSSSTAAKEKQSNEDTGKQKSMTKEETEEKRSIISQETEEKKSTCGENKKDAKKNSSTGEHKNSEEKKDKTEDYFEKELQRLRKKMTKAGEEIKEKKPPHRAEFQPDIYNSLEPYANLHDAEFCISKQEDPTESGHASRHTATNGVPDPWISHRMDVEIPPRQKPRQNNKENKQSPKGKPKDTQTSQTNTKRKTETKSREPLPTYRTVTIDTKSLSKKEKLLFTDVKKVRRRLRESQEVKRKESDCEREKEVYYELELDKEGVYSPRGWLALTNAYSAYLTHSYSWSMKAVSEEEESKGHLESPYGASSKTSGGRNERDASEKRSAPRNGQAKTDQRSQKR